MSLAVVHPESQAVLQPVQAAVPGIQLAFETGIAIIKEGVRLRKDLQPGIPLKGCFHRKDACIKAALIPYPFYLIQPEAVFYIETVHPGTGQVLHASAAAQLPADVMAQGPYVSPLGTGNGHPHPGKLHLVHTDFQDLDLSGLAFHFLSCPGKLIQLFPVHLKRGIHGRNLVIIPFKSQHGFCHSCFLQSHGRMMPVLQYLSRCILCVGGHPQQHDSFICLGPVRQHVAEPGTHAKAYGKHTLGRRVQGSGMSNLLLL